MDIKKFIKEKFKDKRFVMIFRVVIIVLLLLGIMLAVWIRTDKEHDFVSVTENTPAPTEKDKIIVKEVLPSESPLPTLLPTDAATIAPIDTGNAQTGLTQVQTPEDIPEEIKEQINGTSQQTGGVTTDEFIKGLGFDFRPMLHMPSDMEDHTLPTQSETDANFVYCNKGFTKAIDIGVKKGITMDGSHASSDNSSLVIQFSYNNALFTVRSYGLSPDEVSKIFADIMPQQ